MALHALRNTLLRIPCTLHLSVLWCTNQVLIYSEEWGNILMKQICKQMHKNELSHVSMKLFSEHLPFAIPAYTSCGYWSHSTPLTLSICIRIVFQSIPADKINIIEEVLDSLILMQIYLWHHGRQVHGLGNYVKVIRNLVNTKHAYKYTKECPKKCSSLLVLWDQWSASPAQAFGGNFPK